MVDRSNYRYLNPIQTIFIKKNTMYKEIIENEIRTINPETNELGISETLSTALTREGYPDIFCLGIFNGGERMFEGVLMDGVNIGEGPLLRFTYDWDTDEFNEL